ncbi:MAG TPA: SusC/RagA family TonB-linked outer membrane protein [Niabella sp.]|nr:SusC/RagA family TonB-linked outer membrane protein [Niabella sp.]
MRKLCFLLLVMHLAFSVYSHGQTVTLSLNNAPIEKAFSEIKKQTGYTFIYTRAQLATTLSVTLKLQSASLKSVLDACFMDQPLKYSIDGNYVVVQNRQPGVQTEKKIIPPISGKVVDQSGSPLANVTITAKKSKITGISNEKGLFTLQEVVPDDILLITRIGYEQQEIPVNHQSYFNITMKQFISELDETVVMAYGITSRRFNTGNIGKVSAEDINKQPVSNPLAAIQGRIPGVVITQTSGVPGAAINVEIRGRTSLDFNISKNDPLYIVDGVPFEMGNTPTNLLPSAANNPTSISEGGLSALNIINPQDIESIEVLKDADATAIYGSRGANGVILITTKLGTSQKLKINVKVSTGTSKVTRLMKMLNTSQYVAMRKEAFTNDGITPTITNAPDILLWDTTRYTDVQKILAGGTAKYNDALFSVSGGNQQTSFLIGAAFHKETTVLPGNLSNTRISANSSLNHTTLNKRFSFTLKTIYGNENNNIITHDPSQYFRLPPNIMLYDSTGNLVWQEKGVSFSSVSNLINPLALLNRRYQSNNDNLSTNLNVKFELLKRLYLKSSFGYNIFRTDEASQNPKSSIDPASSTLPSAMFGNSVSKNWIIEPQIEYLIQLQKAKLNLLLGSTFQNREYQGTSITGSDYTNDLSLSTISAAGNIVATNFYNQYRYNAFFGRFNFSWEEKYLLNLTARRDGSSRFGPQERFSNFGAVGGAWIFTSEKLFQNNIKWLSFGKLRSSYGVSGNDQIGDYKFYDLWRNSIATYQGLSGYNPVSLFNPDYEWERNRKFEIAGEFSFIKDRIGLSAAYYRHRSSNQLVNYNLPRQAGFSSVVRNLPALVQNTGMELSLTGRIIKRFVSTYTTSFNLTIPKNKLISFPGLSQSTYYSIYVEGQSLNIIRRFKFTGVDPETGIYTFEDVDKDGALTTSKDYQLLGDRDPDFYGGWQNNVTYKGFELDFFIQFIKQTGRNYLSSVTSYPPGRSFNQPDIVLDRWTKPGDNKPFQKYTTASSTPAGQASGTRLNLSDGIYSDASFLRLKTVSISYQPQLKFLSWSNSFHSKIFLSAQNLFTVTNYKGADPETQSYFQLPPMKTLVFGIQLTF